MTDHIQEPPPPPLLRAGSPLETPSDVFLGPQSFYDFCHSKRQDPSHNDGRDNSRIMGKQKQGHRTREAVRFTELILQLERAGISQSEMARLMSAHAHGAISVDVSYINHHRNGRRDGIGSSIIRMVRDAFNIDPDYFFDDYEGVKDHKLYYLDERRVEKQLREMRAEHDRKLAELQAEIAALRDAQQRTDADLAQVTRKPRPALVPPPTRKPTASKGPPTAKG